MSKNFKNTLAIYLFFIVIILATYIYYSSNIYDSLTVVKSSQENKGDLNIKIPDKIILSNPYLGTTVISNKSELNELLHILIKYALLTQLKKMLYP